MKRLLIIIALLSFLSKGFSQSSAEHFASALMPMKKGAEVVYSSDFHSFTMDIISDNLKPLDQPGYINVDNKILQFVFIPKRDTVKKIENTEEEQKVRLLSYMQYELDYVKNDVKLDYTDLAHEWVTINNKIFLLWYYGMPVKTNIKTGTVTKQINLSTLFYGNVLNLNTPFIKDDVFDDDKGLLLKVAQTAKQNEFKIDFNALYRKLNPQ